MNFLNRTCARSAIINGLMCVSLAAMPPVFVAAVDKTIPDTPIPDRKIIPRYVEEIRYNPLRFYTRYRCKECPFRARFRVHYETHVLDLCEDHYNILDIVLTSDQLPSPLSQDTI